MNFFRILFFFCGLIVVRGENILAADKKFAEEFLKARDPFRAPSLEKIVVGKKDELELFPLDSIKMIGVLTGPDHLRAIVQIPDGKTYLVAEKMKLGIHQGFIKKITPDAIVVREKITNILGENEYFDSEIPMASEKSLDDSNASVTQPSPDVTVAPSQAEIE